MRLYLEAVEIVTGMQEAEFVRLEVTGMTQVEQDEVRAALEDLMVGVPHKTILHSCHHDEGRACSSEVVI